MRFGIPGAWCLVPDTVALGALRLRPAKKCAVVSVAFVKPKLMKELCT